MSPSGLRPVVVVAEARTGTNLLRTMADQSGAYRIAFEFLLPPNNPVWEQVNFWSVLDSIGRPSGCRWPRDGHHGDESFAAYFAEVTRRAEGRPLWFDVKYTHLLLFEDGPGQEDSLTRPGSRFGEGVTLAELSFGEPYVAHHFLSRSGSLALGLGSASTALDNSSAVFASITGMSFTSIVNGSYPAATMRS